MSDYTDPIRYPYQSFREGRNSDDSISKILGGVMPLGRNAYIPPLKESTGYVFIGRTQFNLSYNNLQVSRDLMALYTETNHINMAHYIRCLHDPRFAKRPGNSDSKLIDPNCSWNPLLSNCISELSGWPDQIMDIWTSEPGRLKETFSIADGTHTQFGHFTLNATLKNIYGNALGLYLKSYISYIGLVHDGVVIPYGDILLRNERDYDMSIFRLVMDETNTYVVGIGYTVGFINVNPNGTRLNFNEEEATIEDSQTISIAIECDGCHIDDPILFELFNATSGMLNDTLRVGNLTPDSQYYVKCANHSEASIYGQKVYPWINTATAELQWWVDKEVYDSVNEVV